MLRTSSQWVKRQRPPIIPELAASNASARCLRWYSQPGPSSQPASSSSSPSKQASAQDDSSEAKQPRDARRNPLYPNSKAAHRPHPHLRSPLFKARVITAPKWQEGPTDTDGKGGLLKKLRIARDAGNLRNVVQISNRFAAMCRREGSRPPAFIYYVVLHVLAANGLVEECEEVMTDARASGIDDFNAGLAYNYALRAAANKGDNEAVNKYLAVINALPERINPTLPQSSGSQPSAPLLQVTDTRNFNEYTYETLFKHHFFLRQPEAALALFATLVKECSTSTESLFHYMTPGAGTFLLQTLLEASEHRLAVELAEWLRAESSGRLVSPAMWMHLARQCATGDYLPGLKLAWQHAVVNAKHSPDEGTLLAALATAARAPDSAFCLEVLTAFLSASSNYTHMRTSDAHCPPLHAHHLMPLVEAYSLERNFRAAIRLLGAMAHWGYTLDQASLGVLEMSACSSGSALRSAISAWQHVVEEGRRADLSAPPPSVTGPAQRAGVLARIAEGRSEAFRGQVDVTTLNAILGAAARMGDDDAALALWEERRLVRLRPRAPAREGGEGEGKAEAGEAETETGQGQLPLPPGERRKPARSKGKSKAKAPQGHGPGLQPTTSTFNALLLACLRRSPPSTALGLSLMDDFLRSYDVPLNPTSFERMVALYLLPSNASLPPTQENRPPLTHLRAAFDMLEECKKRRLTPTQGTYEALVRACLLNPVDERWRALLREMVRQAGHWPGRRTRRMIYEMRYREGAGVRGIRDMRADLAGIYGEEFEHLADLPLY